MMLEFVHFKDDDTARDRITKRNIIILVEKILNENSELEKLIDQLRRQKRKLLSVAQ